VGCLLLIAFLKGLDYQLYENSEDLRTFLGVYDARNTKPISDGISFRLTKDDAELQSVLISDVPSITLSNDQSVFISSLLSTTQTCLQQLDSIKQKLDKIYGYDTRIEFLSSVNIQRAEAVEQLQEVKSVYVTLISDAMVKEHLAYELLVKLYKMVNLAIKWGINIERQVMLEVTQQTGVWDRIKEYQTETEAKLTLLVQVSESESGKIKEQLNQLAEKIQNDIQSCARYEDDEARQSLETLLTYIKSGISQSSDNSLPSRIKTCESELFLLIESINRLTLDNTEEDFLSLKRKLTLLTKEISSLRNSLEKQIATGENVAENKARVDRLEDFQENLSDLTYTYSNKFEAYSRSLSEMTNAVVSKKKNTKNIDNLYEL